MRLLLALLLVFLSAAAAAEDGDVALYADVASEVRNGDSYYDAVSRLHRERNYPLKPAVTVRPPALAYLSATLGTRGLLFTAWALLLVAIAVWHRTLKDGLLWERLAVSGLLAAGGGAMISPIVVQVHEFWAGLLLTIALGLRWHPTGQIVIVTIASLIREFAIPMLGMLLFPLSKYRTIFVVLATAVVAAYYLAHVLAVHSVILPGDLPTQGWFGQRGFAGLTDNLFTLTDYQVPLPFALLPLAGWLYFARRDPLPFLWCSGVIGAVCIVARDDNLFWIMMMFPVYFAGLAFLGTLMHDMIVALYRRLKPA